MSFDELDRISGELRGPGWRHLAPAQTVRCYLASTWVDAIATEVNGETREMRVEYPVVTRGLRHFVLDASQYQPSSLLFSAGGALH